MAWRRATGGYLTCESGEPHRLMVTGLREVATMRAAFLLIAALLVSSCARPNYRAAWPDHVVVAGGPQLGYFIKQVIEKQAPATLRAEDGSVCRTSPERFRATPEGEWIACEWTLEEQAS
jgi:hypothetical protein